MKPRGPINRWTALPKYPITQTLFKTVPRVDRLGSHIISEQLCDDSIQRLSPFLRRNPPVDILDLWPGPGVLSSKINDFLRPRRHLLIEPRLKVYKPLLEPLAESRPCYQLDSKDLQARIDWKGLLASYFPEQGPLNTDRSGALPRNDTLLVLAQPPPPASRRDHFTGARWISSFMEDCIRQSGLHAYGSVRLLVTMTEGDSQAILPRALKYRSRPALLTEQLALHAFEVAAPAPSHSTRGEWGTSKQWDILVDGNARVAQRTVEKDVVVPVGREFPPVKPGLQSPDPGKNRIPHVPRIWTQQHEKQSKIFEAFDKANQSAPDYKDIKSERKITVAQLNLENHRAYIRSGLARQQAEIDDLNVSVARLAADSKPDLARIESVVKEIDSIRTSLEEELAKVHSRASRSLPNLIDDRRAVFYRQDFDDAPLLWDRRPFEPLLMNPDESYPRSADRPLLYFEANPNAPVVRRINRLSEDEKVRAFEFFGAVSSSLGTDTNVAVTKVCNAIFPGYSANDLVKAAPSLAKYANKRPKPDFESLPKTLHYNPDDLDDPSSKPDPALCYQENLDYDISGISLRILPAETLWDLATEYARHGENLTSMQLTRLLGGTITSAQAMQYMVEYSTLKRKLK
ncbi:hypothetical protein BJX61DRAFT_417438 [Aspergillus egyptiacus]|nr:hypothetical protein BJX61DRAFT_417438 [Aspergillus egyptiacus]